MALMDETNHNAHVIHLNNEYEIKRELTNIQADKKAYNLLAEKMIFLHSNQHSV